VSAPALAVRSLTKRYGEVVGIEDLTLTVERGEAFGLLGPNGAGKSTVIRTVLGFQRPTSGEIRLLGRDATDRRELVAAKGEIGHLPSDFDFYGKVTGAALLDYFGQLKGDRRRAELLDRFPVPVDRAIRTYSRGNKQKLAIVQAFMHDPALVVMDEPTTGLDPMVQSEFRDLLAAEREAGTTVVFSTHILREIRQVCDRVAIVRNGRLAALDSVDALVAERGKFVRATFDDPPDPDAFAIEGVHDVRARPDGTLELVATGNYDRLLDRLARAGLRDVEIREADVEEVFMRYYERDDAERARSPPEGETR
jgi:ABC-2 type transport system ATP-binding protein